MALFGKPKPPDTRPRLVKVKTKQGKRSVCVPVLPESKGAAPALILAFHGGNGNALEFAGRSGLAETVQQYGHHIAFPQARRHWSDGRPPIEAGWRGDRALVETLLDRHRSMLGGTDVPLALVGGSNGGIFAMRLACEMARPPAITVAIVAAMTEAVANRCADGPPANMMLVQGTADILVRWEGGEVPDVGGHTIRGTLLSADDTVDFWKRRNRISGKPRQKKTRIGQFPVRIDYWDGGDDGADLWRVVIVGGGHRQLDDGAEAARPGTLQDLIGRTLMWYIDRARLEQEFSEIHHKEPH